LKEGAEGIRGGEKPKEPPELVIKQQKKITSLCWGENTSQGKEGVFHKKRETHRSKRRRKLGRREGSPRALIPMKKIEKGGQNRMGRLVKGEKKKKRKQCKLKG